MWYLLFTSFINVNDCVNLIALRGQLVFIRTILTKSESLQFRIMNNCSVNPVPFRGQLVISGVIFWLNMTVLDCDCGFLPPYWTFWQYATIWFVTYYLTTLKNCSVLGSFKRIFSFDSFRKFIRFSNLRKLEFLFVY